MRTPAAIDRRRFARRTCIERRLGLFKRSRRVATRHDKTAKSFLSFIQPAAIARWMRIVRTAWRAPEDGRYAVEGASRVAIFQRAALIQ